MATQYVWTAVSCVLTFWILYGDTRGRAVAAREELVDRREMRGRSAMLGDEMAERTDRFDRFAADGTTAKARL